MYAVLSGDVLLAGREKSEWDHVKADVGKDLNEEKAEAKYWFEKQSLRAING